MYYKNIKVWYSKIEVWNSNFKVGSINFKFRNSKIKAENSRNIKFKFQDSKIQKVEVPRLELQFLTVFVTDMLTKKGYLQSRRLALLLGCSLTRIGCFWSFVNSRVSLAVVNSSFFENPKQTEGRNISENI